jgi:hypothetical protein
MNPKKPGTLFPPAPFPAGLSSAANPGGATPLERARLVGEAERLHNPLGFADLFPGRCADLAPGRKNSKPASSHLLLFIFYLPFAVGAGNH